MGFSLDWLISGKGFMMSGDLLFEGFIHCCDMLLGEQEVGIEIVCNGRRVYVNTAMEHLTGYSADELMGELPGSLSPPSERKRIHHMYDTLMSSEEGMGNDVFNIQLKGGTVKKVKACYGRFQYDGKQALIILVRDNSHDTLNPFTLKEIQTDLTNKQRGLAWLFNALLMHL